MSNLIKRLALFGSTGSIGRQTLDVAERLGMFDVVLLAARSDWKLLAEQARRWRPRIVVIADESHCAGLTDALNGLDIRILAGPQAATESAIEIECDIALNALVGVSGLLPSFELLKRGIDLALANKESLVLAGELLNQTKAKSDARMLPVDSEHSAIFQCLQGEKTESVKRLILTASGGPFRDWRRDKISNATPQEALNHPTWKMGAKVTVDSASLMNKGLEVIEAYHLFGIGPDRIDVRIHPVSTVHSLIQFVDGSFKAQLGRPDMRLPIQYALTFPNRVTADYLNNDDPSDWPELSFQAVDRERFPCLGLAYRALEMGGTTAAMLNGADEVAVERFLAGEIRFGQIAEILASALDEHQAKIADNIETVIKADRQGREFARAYKS